MGPEIDATSPVRPDRPAVFRNLDFDASREAWDQWLRDAPGAGGSQLSAHLNSFRGYRGEPSLHVVQDASGRWLAGVGLIAWKVPGTGAAFGVGMDGPAGNVAHFPVLLEGLSDWCRQRNWMCVELCPHLPDTQESARDALTEAGFRPSPLFAPVSGIAADLRVPLRGVTEQQLLHSFRRQTRQHITRSLQEGYQLSLPTSEAEIRTGIDFLHATSIENDISFGPLGRFTSAVLELVRSETGYLVLVRHGQDPLAGGVIVRVGQSHGCYRLATRRDPTHRRAAYYLQWHAMLRALRERADWYYLTGRSTPSVYQFKRGFRPEEFDLIPPHRLVLRPAMMRGIETIQPVALKTAHRLLRLASRLRGRR